MINFTRKKTEMPEQSVAQRRSSFAESQTGYTEDTHVDDSGKSR